MITVVLVMVLGPPRNVRNSLIPKGSYLVLLQDLPTQAHPQIQQTEAGHGQR